MKLLFTVCLILSLSITVKMQIIESSEASYYRLGMLALENNNYPAAEDYFSESIRHNSHADSYYQLAKINIAKNLPAKRELARYQLREAISLEPQNIKYRLLLCSLLKDAFSTTALEEYNKILEIDSACIDAWLGLAEIRKSRFTDYHNSVNKVDNGYLISLEEYALEDYAYAVNNFNKAVRLDSSNYSANFNLALIYEDTGDDDKSILQMEKLGAFFPSDEKVHLYLGLLYYKNNRMKEAWKEYKRSISLMNDRDRKEFLFDSPKMLLYPLLGDKMIHMKDEELEQRINAYWKIKDPLLLTDYNERLLEHFSRVAYSNLRFSDTAKGITGWKTDRGETVLRYGLPETWLRMRPEVEPGARGVEIKVSTEIWYYDDMILAFTDPYMANQFRFSRPSVVGFNSQFDGNTFEFINELRRKENEKYKPKFEGPLLKIPNNYLQFKNRDIASSGLTDVYVNFAFDANDSVFRQNRNNFKYRTGLFFLDKNMNKKFEKIKNNEQPDTSFKLLLPGGEKYFVNSAKMTIQPDSGNLAFEIIREPDNGAASYHGKFKIKNFTGDNLCISDIALASSITIDAEKTAPIIRGRYGILPNPAAAFYNGEPLFVYFEIYNLKKSEDGYTDFEQSLIVSSGEYSESGSFIAKIFNSAFEFIGLKEKDNMISLVGNNRTADDNPRVYLQLDMSKYAPGDYYLFIKIKDNITGETTRAKTKIIRR